MPNSRTDVTVPFHEPNRPLPRDEVRIETQALGERFHVVSTQVRNGKTIKHTNAYLTYDDVARLHLAMKNWLKDCS